MTEEELAAQAEEDIGLLMSWVEAGDDAQRRAVVAMVTDGGVVRVSLMVQTLASLLHAQELATDAAEAKWREALKDGRTLTNANIALFHERTTLTAKVEELRDVVAGKRKKVLA